MYLSDKDYNFIFSNSVRLCVDLFIETEKGVLLGKRTHDPYKNLFALPGGRMFFGESVDDAIRRIAKNEIGVNVEKYQLMDYVEFNGEIGLSGTHSISMVFNTEISGEPKISESFSEICFGRAGRDVIPQHRDLLRKMYY